MATTTIKNNVEGALLVVGEPLSTDRLQTLFTEQEQPDRQTLRDALAELARDYEGRALELKEVGSGFRIQVRQELAPWVSRLWEERPTRYSRAMLETLAIIAYRQPVTRAEIEDVRGVTVSSSIVRTLQEREWIRVVGHRDVPGRPAMFGTTRKFLDYFNLKGLGDLPTLSELRDLEELHLELDLKFPEEVADELAEASDRTSATEDEES